MAPSSVPMRSRTPTPPTQTRPSRRARRSPPARILLAKLAGEHPQLAREFGVDPDGPELEELGKAKAASLTGAMLDRVNAQAPPDER